MGDENAIRMLIAENCLNHTSDLILFYSPLFVPYSLKIKLLNRNNQA